MKDFLEKTEFLDTSIYKVKFESPLQNDVLKILHSSWGTLGKNGNPPPFFPGPQPISIERKHFENFLKKEYVVCEKTDGLRFVCMCIKYSGKNLCLLVNRALDIYLLPLNMPRKSYSGTILDGEVAKTLDGNWHYMVYDCIWANGADIRNKNLFERLEGADNTVKNIMKLGKDPITLKVKTFYKFTDFKNFYENVLPKINFNTDGLVFTPVEDSIKIGTHETMFKWKPRDKNTIDFQVKKRSDSLGLYIQEKGTLFFQSILPLEEWSLNEDDIVECQYMVDDPVPWWKPVGVRTDKTYPNNRRTFFRTLKNISEDIQPCEFISVCKKPSSDEQ